MIENYYSIIEDNCLNARGLNMTNHTFNDLIDKMKGLGDSVVTINIIDIRNNNIHNFDFQLIKKVFPKVNMICCDSKKSVVNIDGYVVINYTYDKGCSCSIL